MNQKLTSALKQLGLADLRHSVAIGNDWQAGQGDPHTVRSPIDGSTLAEIHFAGRGQVQAAMEAASEAFRSWRVVPAPARGELVRRFGERLRAMKSDLATLVSWETGKITQEALGEVQEMIDICDFAVGLSRQLYGKTIASERPLHRLAEYWHPLGPIGVITAFNFPVAVWAWNAAIALVCGDPSRMEAVGEGASVGPGLSLIARASDRRFRRRTAGLEQRCRGGSGRRRATCGKHGFAASFRHRFGAHGPRGGTNGGGAIGPFAVGTGR